MPLNRNVEYVIVKGKGSQTGRGDEEGSVYGTVCVLATSCKGDKAPYHMSTL